MSDRWQIFRIKTAGVLSEETVKRTKIYNADAIEAGGTVFAGTVSFRRIKRQIDLYQS